MPWIPISLRQGCCFSSGLSSLFLLCLSSIFVLPAKKFKSEPVELKVKSFQNFETKKAKPWFRQWVHTHKLFKGFSVVSIRWYVWVFAIAMNYVRTTLRTSWTCVKITFQRHSQLTRWARTWIYHCYRVAWVVAKGFWITSVKSLRSLSSF